MTSFLENLDTATMSVDPQTQSLFDAISTINYNRVKLLIDSGVALNSPNDRGQTPLAVACHRGNLEIVDLLVAAGAQMKVEQAPISSSPTISDNQQFEATISGFSIEDPALMFDNLTDLIHQPDDINTIEPDKLSLIDTYQSSTVVDFDRIASELRDRVETPATTSSPLEHSFDWQESSLDLENFQTFDLDEAFATKEISDTLVLMNRDELFGGQELTKSDIQSQTKEVELEETETYLFDLSQDLDRLTVNAVEEPDSLSIPMGELESNETYVMDLDSFDLFASEADEIELNSPQQGVLASFSSGAAVEIGSSGDSSGVSAKMLQQIAKMDKSMLAENAFTATETWTEGETYAVDLNDLSLSKLITGMDLEIQSIGAVSPLAPQHILSELDSSLFPVMGGEDEPDYDSDTEDSGDLIGYRQLQSDDLIPAHDTNATNTSLMAAVIDGDLDLVKQSIEAGANLDGYDWNLSYAPLGMAIDRGYLELVECLLTAGANPHCGSITTTALGLAAERGEIEIIQLLLARRVDVNTPVSADGWTALLSTIENGHRSIVQLLVTAGANVNAWSRGETPILLAAKCEEREIYNYLYPLVNTAIRLCADRDGEHLLQATQKRRIRQQNRPVEKFIEMATIGNTEEVKRAIEVGIEIDELGAKGHTALMAAAYYGHRSIVKLLLAAGADPNLLSDDDGLGMGMTTLMLAAGSFFASNRQYIVKMLITGGADPNQRGVGGKTAIFYSALAGSGYKDCVETLIAAGADLNLRDDRGYTVLTAVAAAENYAMMNILMQAGASTAGLESIQLIQAAGAGNLDRVQSLLTTKANLNFDRGAAIGNAAAAGHTQIVELLIRAGANVNLRDKLGFTPISSAAYLGYGEIVNLLIAAGADIQAPAGESQSYSALEYAQMGLYRSGSTAEIQQRHRASAESDLLVINQCDDLQHAQIIKKLEHLS
jgi:ankyrin repeat protein